MADENQRFPLWEMLQISWAWFWPTLSYTPPRLHAHSQRKEKAEKQEEKKVDCFLRPRARELPFTYGVSMLYARPLMPRLGFGDESSSASWNLGTLMRIPNPWLKIANPFDAAFFDHVFAAQTCCHDFPGPCSKFIARE